VDQLRHICEVCGADQLIDLEHVYSRARLVWGGESARIWMESADVFLGGVRPLDVLLTEGAGPTTPTTTSGT
jgi:uncharacterized protein (DUF2384 family)